MVNDEIIEQDHEEDTWIEEGQDANERTLRAIIRAIQSRIMAEFDHNGDENMPDIDVVIQMLLDLRARTTGGAK